jgi:hypothetical protein
VARGIFKLRCGLCGCTLIEVIKEGWRRGNASGEH